MSSAILKSVEPQLPFVLAAALAKPVPTQEETGSRAHLLF